LRKFKVAVSPTGAATRSTTLREGGILKDRPQSKLQLATTLLGSVDAEIAAIQIISRAEPIHMIEQVIVLRPQLQSKTCRSVTSLQTCHPPFTRSRPCEIPPANRLPFPIGRSQTLANVNRWRTSTSALPLSSSGLSGFEKPQVLGPVPPVQKLPGELSSAC